MRTIDLNGVDVVRAGSDYLQVCWSINVVGKYVVGETYKFEHGNGGYEAIAVRRERMDGKATVLFVEQADSFLFY